MTINRGRMTHRYDGELVVFLIGMTINRWWRVDQWWPVFAAMPGMLAELSRDPGSGLLGYRLTFGAGGPLVVQYWNSHEKLYDYASARDAQHRPAWTRFNQRARKRPGVVGIWHETYQVARAESIYAGAPTMGLAKATEVVPVQPRGDRAAARLAAGEVAVAVGEPATRT
ncbi:DUF4188 domain-containing protein [Microlunatus ginsengisoli]|uniref:DUF4188 domain-containing protein n=1 Tax=Microlunatus ginsengisoli TaxID=363863 RepID=A0ABP7AMP8_9ACTN